MMMADVVPSQNGTDAQAGASHERPRTSERRRRSRSSAFAVVMLFALSIASFVFLALVSTGHETHLVTSSHAVRALIAAVLLFTVYVVYQQTAIGRMRNALADQSEALAKIQALTNEVYKLAAIDPLTGLYNRRSGEQRLAQEISRAIRYSRPLTVLLLDLDGFKQTNDRFGHAAGDVVLKAFSERLQRAIRGSDFAVRLGGDEFMVLLPECRPDQVRYVLNRVAGLQLTYEGGNITCQFSGGWAEYKLGETGTQLLKRADEALYANKRAGKAMNLAKPSNLAPQTVA